MVLIKSMNYSGDPKKKKTEICDKHLILQSFSLTIHKTLGLHQTR